MAKTITMRNISGGPLLLGGRRVEPDEVIHVEGDLAPKKHQVEDAIVIGTDDEARAYPTSTWRQVGTAKTVEPDVPAPVTPEETP